MTDDGMQQHILLQCEELMRKVQCRSQHTHWETASYCIPHTEE